MPKLRSIVKFALKSVCRLLAVIVVVGLGLSLRLVSGPLETGVPQGLLDRVMAEAAPGWHVAAGGAELDFSSDDGLNGLKLRDVVLSDSAGQQVVRVPTLGLRFALTASLDPAEALTVREVALTGASVDVTRDADGVFQLALGDLSTGGGGGDDTIGSLADLGDLSQLPSLRIEEAEVRYTDLARGTTWRTEKARLLLTPTEDGLSGILGVRVDGGIGEAQLDAFHSSETGQVTATLTLNGVRPSRVADLDPLLAPLGRIDAPLSGTVTVRADDGGAFQQISAVLTAAPGFVTIEDAPSPLESFAAAFSCQVAASECQLVDMSIRTAEFSAAAHGSVRQTGGGDVALALTIENGLARQGSASAGFVTGRVFATMDQDTGQILFNDVELSDVSLTGLPDGMSIAMMKAQGAGSFDPQTELLQFSTLTSEGLTMTDASDARVELSQAKGGLRVDLAGKRVALSGFEASGLTIAADGLGVQVTTTTGQATINWTTRQIALDGATLTGLRVAQAGRNPSEIASLSLSGTIDAARQTLSGGKVKVRGAVLSLPELYDRDVRVDDLTAKLAATHDKGRIKLAFNDAKATIDGLSAKLAGIVALRKDGSALGKIDASLGPVAFADLPRHWPLGVAPGGLSWVRDNARQGSADKVTINAQFDEAKPDADSLDLRFGFRDARVSFALGMPPIESARGTGHVTLDRLDLNVTKGSVNVPKAGKLSVDGSSFAIPDFAPDVPNGQVRLLASGDVKSVLRLLDTDPLGVISPTGFEISKAKGRADVQVMVELPLSDDLRLDDVRFDARAKIHEYDLIEPDTGLQITGDVLRVKATPTGLTLDSDARIGGMAARMGFRQGFNKPKDGQPDSTLTLEAFLSPKDFARHGLVIEDHVEGLTALKTRIEMFEGGTARINADADLTNLNMKVDSVGWAKPAGVPATIKMSGFRSANGTGRIETLALRGEGLSADGSIGFGADGQISRANFTRVILGSAIDVGVIYGRKSDGEIGVLVKGARLDLRHAFAQALEGRNAPKRPAGSGKDADISIQVARVYLRDDLGVYDLKGGIRLRSGALHAANVTGKLNGTAQAKVLAERRRDGLAIRLTAPNSGALIRAADVFSGAYDGSLTLDAVTRDTVSPSQISGRIIVSDMIVHDAPTLRRILSGGAVGSLLDDLANGGIKFTKIELPFRGVGPRWQIEDGVAYGPQIGLTLEGGYDVAHSQLALTGSVSPAYAINGALGKVPLLGSLLTGGEGEGVFGVTFSVDGDSNKPVVNVNPLSALAPGFLRKFVAK